MMIALALALAQPPAADATPVPPFIQAERTFAARAQVDGQWTAFRAFAARDAIMLAPGPVNAHQFLARFKSDPAVPVMWWPSRAWVSCDGSLAVTVGPWVRKGGVEVGTFTTVWRREPNGSWKWVYDNSRPIPRAIEAPDVPPVFRAACRGEAPVKAAPAEERNWMQREGMMPGEWDLPFVPVPDAPPVASGRSADGSLRWEVHHHPKDGPNAYMFQVWQLTAHDDGVPAAAGAAPEPAQSYQLVVVDAHGYPSSPSAGAE